jgi:hypothetical protein
MIPQAIADSERARELDPLSAIINTGVGSRYFLRGDMIARLSITAMPSR